MVVSKKLILIVIGALVLVGAIVGLIVGLSESPGKKGGPGKGVGGDDNDDQNTVICDAEVKSVAFSTLKLNAGGNAIDEVKAASDYAKLVVVGDAKVTSNNYVIDASCAATDPMCTENFFNVFGAQTEFQAFEIPVAAAGKYAVTLNFAPERGSFKVVGARIFDIKVNDASEEGVDLFSRFGTKAGSIVMYPTVDASKKIAISFKSIVQNPRVNSIDVEGVIALSLNSNTYDFGTVYMGEGASHKFSLSNVLPQGIEVHKITVEGDGFSVKKVNYPAVLSSKCDPLTITVLADPEVEGELKGTVIIDADNLASTDSIINLSMIGKKRITSLFINAGANADATIGGESWVADTKYALGGTVVNNNVESIYGSQRFWAVSASDKGYNVPAFNGAGKYMVTLYFEESYSQVLNGNLERIFSVAVNGIADPAGNINILEESPQTKRTTRDFEVTLAEGESIQIRFFHNDPVAQNPMVNGIEINFV